VDSDKTFLTAHWQNLAMLNYEVEADLLRPFVPTGTELDRWNEKAFVSLVGFQFLKTKLFGCVPIPMHSNFDEVNLRFYVRRQVGGEVRRGVVFIKEIVPRRAIAFVARTFYNENYIALPMRHDIQPHGDACLSVAYQWQGQNSWSEVRVQTKGPPELASEGSFEQFITEHYWGYAEQPDGGSVEYRITHPSWRVWQVGRAAFNGNAEDLYGKEIAAVLARNPVSAFLAEGSAVAVRRGQRL